MVKLKSILKLCLKNAVWFGIGLISAGLTSGVIAGFMPLQTGLIIAGANWDLVFTAGLLE